MHPGAQRDLDAAEYAGLLAEAGTTGFSVYLAETRMDEAQWQALGAAVAQYGLAQLP